MQTTRPVLSLDRGNTTPKAEIIRLGHGARLELARQRPSTAALHDQIRVVDVDYREFAEHWQELPQDPYPGGEQRSRRLTRFRVTTEGILPLPRTEVYQTTHFNRLDGGIARDFEPLAEDFCRDRNFHRIAETFLGRCPESVIGWTLGVHTIRVTATAGVGEPTAQGVHRDERDYVGVMIVNHHNAVLGPSSVYLDPKAPAIWSSILNVGDLWWLDDERVFHYTEPFRAREGQMAHRDIMILTLTRQSDRGTVAAALDGHLHERFSRAICADPSTQ